MNYSKIVRAAFNSHIARGVYTAFCIGGGANLIADSLHPLDDQLTMIPRDDLLINLTVQNENATTLFNRNTVGMLDEFAYNSITSYHTDSTEWYTNNGLSIYNTGTQTFSARLWNHKKDAILTFHNIYNVGRLSIGLNANNNNPSSAEDVLHRSRFSENSLEIVHGVNTDFIGQGSEQFLYMGMEQPAGTGNFSWHAKVIKALDKDDPSQGIETIDLDLPGLDVRYGSPVVADFDRDGNQEVAMLTSDGLEAWTVCAGNITDTICEGQNSYDVVYRGQFTTGLGGGYMGNHGLSSAELVVGNFFGNGTPLLFMVGMYPHVHGRWQTEARYIQFTSDDSYNMSSHQHLPFDFRSKIIEDQSDIEEKGGYVFASKYKKSPWASQDQVVVFQQKRADGTSSRNVRYLTMLNYNPATFDIDTATTKFDESNNYRAIGALVGNYRDITDSGSTVEHFEPQVAVMELKYHKQQDARLTMYDFDWSGGVFWAHNQVTPSLIEEDTRGGNYYTLGMPFRTKYEINNNEGNDKRIYNRLRLTGARGNSEKLGSPLYVSYSAKNSLDTKLAAVPAHIDYVISAEDDNEEPSLFNISYFPTQGLLNSELIRSNGASFTSSHQKVNTLTNAVNAYTKVESEAKGSVSGASIEVGASLEVGGGIAFENKADTLKTNTNSVSYSLQQTAYLDDSLKFEDELVELYMYPVYGDFYCIDGSESCEDEDKAQRYIHVVDTNYESEQVAVGTTVSWYQPAYENGNLLSYPTSEAQVEVNNEGSLQEVATPIRFSIGGHNVSQKITWKSDKGITESETGVKTTSWYTNTKASVGVSQKVGDPEGTGYEGSIRAEVGSAYKGSHETQNVITGIKQFDSKATVNIDMNSLALRDAGKYSYVVKPLIYGYKKPEGAESSLNKSSASSSNVKNTINTNGIYEFVGPLLTDFYVSVTGSGTGNWWVTHQVYSDAIDISFNNPTRWKQGGSNSRDEIGEEGANCVTHNMENTCVIPHIPKDAISYKLDSFYNMQGLYVVDKENGATRHAAYAGEELTLKARVYNYSMKDMAETDTVKVQIYAQELDENDVIVKNSAELIGTADVGPIPAFGGDDVNWRWATIDFDTSNYANKAIHFWLVAWAEDQYGNLISERQGKGLGESYVAGSTYQDLYDVELATTTLVTDPHRGEVEDVDYSFTNNVGFHRQAFAILNANDSESNSMSLTKSAKSYLFKNNETSYAQAMSLTINVEEYEQAEGQVDETMQITASLDVSEHEGDLRTYLVDETDLSNKLIVDMDTRTILPNRTEAIINYGYTPTSCGLKNLIVYVGGLNENSQSSQALYANVACD